MAEPDQAGDYLPIGAYAIIGNCHTAALVANNGSIEWFCPGRFDSAAVFCRVLDSAQGGYLSTTPTGPHSATRSYRGATNILETTFAAPGGRARLIDFMPLRSQAPSHKGQDISASGELIRLIEGLDGEVELALDFKPTFDYAGTLTKVVAVEGGALAHAIQGRPATSLALASPGLSWQPGGDGALCARVRLRAGERFGLALSHRADAGDLATVAAPDFDNLLAATEGYWQSWAGQCSYQGPYREKVLRSALVLKLLTYEPTGAIVAAPTTSLPESIGGVRNWDYRYTWLRDSSLLLYALMTIGYQSEAGDFFHWLRRATETDLSAAPQIMYTVDERRDLPEVILEHLSGYRNSRPVRVGNAASRQLQLDIYGEVLTAAYLHFARPGGGDGKPDEDRPEEATWAVLRDLVEEAARRWQEPDRGIWEVRGGPQRFLYSQLMCWAALDRGLRLAEEFALPAPMSRWETTRAAIREAILTRGYDQREGAFTQAFGNPALDASSLNIPRVGFLSPTDLRMRSTIDRIRRDLTDHGLVYRYRSADGLPGGEGAFVPCSFWLVSALALSGQVSAAHDLLRDILTHTNDVGLISEEIDPASGALLGNFPQGFSHAALINAAVNVAKAETHGAEEEPENEAQRAHRARHAAGQQHRNG